MTPYEGEPTLPARHGRSAETEYPEILRPTLQSDAAGGSFKATLSSMPEVGEDQDFLIPRDLPRESS